MRIWASSNNEHGGGLEIAMAASGVMRSFQWAHTHGDEISSNMLTERFTS
jgi:hypothetical protein